MQGKIFINYRRGDDPGFTGRLFDRLDDHFSPDQLFMDVDSIEPGLDFVKVLNEQVAECDLLLAVIGKGWLDATDKTGARRLDNPEDFVRIEIEAALERGTRVVPVLVNNAEMPRERDLPESLKPFARRNAVRLSHEQFRSDAAGLIKQLEKALAEEAERRLSAATPQAAEDNASVLDGGDAERLRLLEAEEVANWEFVQASRNEFDFRDHLARFPQGKTVAAARARLEPFVWSKLGRWPERAAIDAFLEQFPDGKYAAIARKRRDTLVKDTRREAIADWFSMLAVPLVLIVTLLFSAYHLNWLDPQQVLQPGEPTGLKVGFLATILIALALMFLSLPSLSEDETVSYWLGCVLVADVASRYLLVPSYETIGNGQLYNLALAVALPAVLFFARVWKASDVNLSSWWLGVSWALAFTNFGYLWAPFPWLRLGIEVDMAVELYIGSSIAVALAALSIYWSRRAIGATAIATYWLGCVVAATTLLVLVFSRMTVDLQSTLGQLLDTSSLRQEQLANVVLLVAAPLSAALLAWWAGAGFTAAAARRYWLGCTMPFMLLLGYLFDERGWSDGLFPLIGARSGSSAAYAIGAIVALIVSLGLYALLGRIVTLRVRTAPA